MSLSSMRILSNLVQIQYNVRQCSVTSILQIWLIKWNLDFLCSSGTNCVPKEHDIFFTSMARMKQHPRQCRVTHILQVWLIKNEIKSLLGYYVNKLIWHLLCP